MWLSCQLMKILLERVSILKRRSCASWDSSPWLMNARETSATCPLLRDVGVEVAAVSAAAVDQEGSEDVVIHGGEDVQWLGPAPC